MLRPSVFWSFLQHLGTSEEAPFTVFFKFLTPSRIDWCELGVCDYQITWYHDYCRLLLRKYHD